MDCLEFQGKMIRYVNGELTFKEKEQFMEHVRSCDECRDELEIYYIILNSMRQMDEEVQLTDDFHGEYLAQLLRTEAELFVRKRSRARRRIALPVVVGATVLLTGLSREQNITTWNRSQSVYEMKFRFSEIERHRMYDKNVTDDILIELMEKLNE